MKKTLSLSLAILILVIPVFSAGFGGSSGTGGAAQAQDVYRFAMGWLANERGNMTKAGFHLGEMLEERSNGRFDTTVFHSMTAGTSDRALAENTQQNILQFTSVPIFVIGEFSNIKEFSIGEIPFLFRNQAEADALIVDSGFLAPYYQQFEAQTGLRVLGGYNQGISRIATAKRPLRQPQDITGLKMRSQVSETYMDMLEEWGAAPTPMAFGEIFTALQQGVIDGMIAGSAAQLWDNAFWENLDYVADFHPVLNYHILIINAEFHDSLPSDLRQIFDETVVEYQQFARETVGGQDDGYIRLMEEAGVNIIWLTPEERQVWIDATKETYAKASARLGSEFVRSAEEFLETVR